MLMPIAKEGRSYILIVLLVATLLSIFSFIYPAPLLRVAVLLCWAAFIVVVNFFRDPEREVPGDPHTIISPADGKVLDVSIVLEETYLHREAVRVSIFMSLFDVHVNRAPVEGTITYVHYHKGKYLPAYREKASLDNEHMSIGFVRLPQEEKKEKELKIMIRLIAGVIARRIVFWKKLYDVVGKAERIGMIKFGSRVEIYLPQDVELLIEKGDKVKAGKTIIARMVAVK